jgi:hypothetical protein
MIRIPKLGNTIHNHRENDLTDDFGLLPSSHDTFGLYGIKNAQHCCENNHSKN